MGKLRKEGSSHCAVVCIALALTLTGAACGGSDPRPAPPTAVDSTNLPLGHAFTGSESFQVEPGQTVERGGVRFTCTGATACMVTVDVAAAEVRYTGGMLTVAATIPPTMADTVGLPLGHAFTGSESFQVEPGQTVERGGVRFHLYGSDCVYGHRRRGSSGGTLYRRNAHCGGDDSPDYGRHRRSAVRPRFHGEREFPGGTRSDSRAWRCFGSPVRERLRVWSP